MTPYFNIMPSQRKRIGFLPSAEVHEIIERICSANEFSQSKVTGLLVEEALRSRGVLSDSNNLKNFDQKEFINDSFENEATSGTNNLSSNSDLFRVKKKDFSDDIKLMHEFIEFKHFKKVMKINNNILE